MWIKKSTFALNLRENAHILIKVNKNDMKNFKLWNVVLGWMVFAIAAATYLTTMEPTASFWDCGEFIASAFKLDVDRKSVV